MPVTEEQARSWHTTRNTVFVFGSNLAGRHGAGSALEAIRNWGAVYGRGVGRQGMSYAIPTKDELLEPLSLVRVAHYVQQFLTYAAENPHLAFAVVKIGCGLAGFREDEISPLFNGATPNVLLPEGWDL